MRLYIFHQSNLQATVQPSAGASSGCLPPPSLFNLAILVTKEMILSHKSHCNIHRGIPENGNAWFSFWPKQLFTAVTNSDASPTVTSVKKISEEVIQNSSWQNYTFITHIHPPHWGWGIVSAVRVWKVKKNKPLSRQWLSSNTGLISNLQWQSADGSDRCPVYFFLQRV